MRLIYQKNLLIAIEPYPDAQTAIESWYQLIKDNDWQSLEEMRKGYSKSVDEVYGYTIFNIKGNRYRLIVQINYRTKIIFFKAFLIHAEYSKINWNNQDKFKQKLG
ncbi:MAG: type II toxin-antitoxin system HigB family toxin [Tychonema bourrellyi B0820]|uniref:Type II toxin-antitoxin system HigB family toxin n=1 Tax=Tychonema bourrellyi FEM_GT703 TaxID=2040638 RepID=A0A2G4F0C4_9CYAN|nr:type II toxin-antitoxin system HigB family toxin [Tychonema bourrellyi]MDQ2100755.1 type II toxin-antitoxin system HigB family toxin [Tychonema bourrellyi B0820]PHX54897.1 type II toxin-antitoxin system HigB family toxin [Tychonema bourrellyi FEM_GT703]